MAMPRNSANTGIALAGKFVRNNFLNRIGIPRSTICSRTLLGDSIE
jgi:hypothetical protein